MPILEPILRFFRKKQTSYFPPAPPKRPWAEITPKEPIVPPDSGQIVPQPLEMPPMPEGVDFTALWEEPSDSSSLATIFSGIAAGAAALILILKLFGK